MAVGIPATVNVVLLHTVKYVRCYPVLGYEEILSAVFSEMA